MNFCLIHFTAPCEMIPDECLDFLPYSKTYYPSSESLQQAVALFNDIKAEAAMCHNDATLVLCVELFPPCPDEEQDEVADVTLCKSLCQDVSTSCEGLYNWTACEDLPDGEGDFCSVPEGGKIYRVLHKHPSC